MTSAHAQAPVTITPVAFDAGGKIGAVYGVYDDAAGVDIRGRFIIDPDFFIRAMEVLTPDSRQRNGHTRM